MTNNQEILVNAIKAIQDLMNRSRGVIFKHDIVIPWKEMQKGGPHEIKELTEAIRVINEDYQIPNTMKDYEDNIIRVGDSFLYQFETSFAINGKLVKTNSQVVIEWDDNTNIALDEFYYAPMDSPLLKKIS